MKTDRESGAQMRTKEDLIDLLIHDMVGPLAVASTSTNSLLRKVERYAPLTEQQRRVLEQIQRNVHRAQMLVQEMVEISRSEEGLFQKEHFRIDHVLKEALMDVLEMTSPDVVEKLSCVEDFKELRETLENQGIFMEINGKYDKAPFCHDSKKCQQILRNLMSNALKYRRKRMDVCISGDSNLSVLVEDDGHGIPQEELDMIFKRFCRLQDEAGPKVSGLGFGLTGVKTMVDAMGGDIKVLSRERVGTKFTVRIPPLSQGRKIMAESILNGKKILLVDDEVDVLQVLEDEILSACPDCQIHKATTYEKASEMIKAQTYEVVVLDIMGVRGFDLLDLAVSRNLRVAMLTAHALSPEALKQSYEKKARAYLPKDKLGGIVPFLEDVLKYEYLPGWKRLYGKLKDFFDSKFESDWERRTGLDWHEWGRL